MELVDTSRVGGVDPTRHRKLKNGDTVIFEAKEGLETVGRGQERGFGQRLLLGV